MQNIIDILYTHVSGIAGDLQIEWYFVILSCNPVFGLSKL